MSGVRGLRVFYVHFAWIINSFGNQMIFLSTFNASEECEKLHELFYKRSRASSLFSFWLD